jgi:hypothetical protein
VRCKGTCHFLGGWLFFGFRCDSISVRTYDLDHSFTKVAALARLARAFVRREVKVQCPRLFAWDRQKAYDRASLLMETKRTFDLHLLADAKALIFGEGKR